MHIIRPESADMGLHVVWKRDSYLELDQVLWAQLLVLSDVAPPRLLHQAGQALVHLPHPPQEHLQGPVQLGQRVLVVLEGLDVKG